MLESDRLAIKDMVVEFQVESLQRRIFKTRVR